MADDLPSNSRRRRDRDRPAKWVRNSSASSIGIQIVVCICFGLFTGRWIQDNWTHWAPWTMLIGFGFGVAAAVSSVIKAQQDWKRELELERERRESGQEAEPEGQSSFAALFGPGGATGGAVRGLMDRDAQRIADAPKPDERGIGERQDEG